MLKGKVSVNETNGQRYLHVDALHVDLTVKKMRMMVKNIFKNNRILSKSITTFLRFRYFIKVSGGFLAEAINLFLRENGQEVFKVMLPQLRKKLAGLFMNISNKLLAHVPLDVFYVPLAKQTS